MKEFAIIMYKFIAIVGLLTTGLSLVIGLGWWVDFLIRKLSHYSFVFRIIIEYAIYRKEFKKWLTAKRGKGEKGKRKGLI